MQGDAVTPSGRSGLDTAPYQLFFAVFEDRISFVLEC